MPSNVGMFTNVPIAGDPIRSDWPGSISPRAVHAFATTAARDAWASPPNGAIAVTTDTNTAWLRAGGAWVTLSKTRAAFQAVTTNGSGQVALTFSPPLPAAPAVLANCGVYNLQAMCVTSATTTSATITVVRIADNTSVNNFGINLQWIAVSP